MAISQTKMIGSPRTRRGQGTIEVIVALPVLLLLVFILLQLFLLAVAQVQLRYAAFYAARVGAVRNADIKEMKAAVGKILTGAPGSIPISDDMYRVEKINLVNEKKRKTRQGWEQLPELFKIHVHWDYPLAVPLVKTLLAGLHSDGSFRKVPTVPLHATWTAVRFQTIPGKSHGKKHPLI